MNPIKKAILPSLMATSLFGATLLPAQQASADDRVLRDIGVGAAAGAAAGLITGQGSFLGNAVNEIGRAHV